MAAAVIEVVPAGNGARELYVREVNHHVTRALKRSAEQLINTPLYSLLVETNCICEHDFYSIAAAAGSAPAGSAGDKPANASQPFLLSVPERDICVQVQAVPLPAKGCCMVFLQDITSPMLAAHIGQRLLQSKTLENEYQQLCLDVLRITGAKVVALNLMEPDGKSFRTVGLAGPKASTQEVVAHMGFHPAGRSWKYDPVREERIDGQAVARFPNLKYLVENGLPGHVTKAVQRVLGIGETAIARLQYEGHILGDFTLLMPSGCQLVNEPLLRLIANQTAMAVLQQRSEREFHRFRRIFEEANYGSVITDMEGSILYVNRFFARIHGWSVDELIGVPLFSLAAEGEPELGIKNGAIRPDEILHKHRDGHTFALLMNGMVFSGNDERPEFIALTTTDLTRQHQAEEVLLP